MYGTMKKFFKKYIDFTNVKTSVTKSDDSYRNEDQKDQESAKSSKELTAAKFNKFGLESSSLSDDCEPFVDVVQSKCPCPNIATFLVIILLIIVFLILPIVYLLHCFDLLNTQWPNEEFNRVLTDHSHSNPRKERFHFTNAFDMKSEFNKQKNINNKISLPDNLPFAPTSIANECAKISDDVKFDCFPEKPAFEEACKQRGCCWQPRENTDKLERGSAGVPFCFYPPHFGGYKFVNISEEKYGMSAFLKRTFKSPYPNDVPLVKMSVKYETEQRLHIKLYDPNASRFEPPYPEVPIVEKGVQSPEYRVEVDKKKVGFRVVRKSTNITIFNAQDVGALIFSDQFLQLSSLLPSKNIYGLGEHRSSLRLSTQWQQFALFNHDSIPTENINLYGSHPFYMVMEGDGNSNGVFLLNSNAMEIILQPAPGVTFRTIGGVLDLYVFLGPTPADVVRQYVNLVGMPYMPPYWGLGFHLCRFGYNSLNHTKEVWSRNYKAGIPMDVQWNDLDYMDNRNDFTYDKQKFHGLPEFVEELHQLGMHYVPLIDPGISGAEKPGSYPPYDDGIALDIFIKNSTDQPFIGRVWNRISTVWPDFTNPRTVDYWMKQLLRLHSDIPFDGAWIDMNEPSNFLSGTVTGCPNSTLDYPPYVPAIEGQKLSFHTLCMSSRQRAGYHYDTHNLYGFTEAIVTSFALTEIRGLRPFVISRSTFSGHGHYAGHWSGDIASDWYSMKMSIPQLLSFSIFGIPLMGADICGFNGNTTIPLCQRWVQLGAFYPFSRNHNTDDGIPQDPVALGPDVTQSARKALLIRYSLLPYLYTLFWKAHAYGDTVARPLFFEFPKDTNTYGLDEQFLWGPALMIVPVLEEGKTSVTAYLPKSVWYNYHTLAPISSIGPNGRVLLPAPLDTIPLLLRGGYVLPRQAPNKTTTSSRKNPMELMVCADENGQASGSLYWDDGDSLNTVEDYKYNLLNFTLKNSQLVGEVMHWGYNTQLVLGKILVLGIPAPVKSVFVNQASHPFSYNTINKFLKVKNLDLPLNKNFNMHWA